MNKASDKDYAKNNKVVELALSRFSKTEVISLLNASESLTDRQRIGQSLIDYLCGKFNIPKCKLVVLNTAQPHSTTSRGTLATVKKGDYNTLSMNIRIWNLTAARKNVVSIKSFLEVLLHEFIHHYDMRYLKFTESPHTSGFYKRLGDLQNKLK